MVVVDVVGVEKIIQGKYLKWHNPEEYKHIRYSVGTAYKGDCKGIFQCKKRIIMGAEF